jgi:cbb3-type cytochrome oxidase maturation protein
VDVIFIVLPLALLVAGGFLYAFARAARGGQFDDLDTPAWRVVVDEDGEVRGKRD